METKIPKLAIIAGNGSIPFYLVEECKNKGREYCLIIIDGHAKELSENYKPDFVVSLSKMGKAIKFVKELTKVVATVVISDLKRIDFPANLVFNGFIGFKNKSILN